ncbi:epigen isoform X4 [Phyllostomus hastatus]|uniref:epigen isoform X4 n=1 Tax=Phyllostomus hastatus TaxID=9423 RepID=UPI001E6858B1|nr:epigen isoform X4 [Phyllostomus hastatus]
MAFGVSVLAFLLFNAMAALTEEVALNGTPGITTQASDSLEGPIALKLSHSCLEDHNSYCINGACAFHHELKEAICRCFTGYTGERCPKLKSPYDVSSRGRPL